MLATAIGEFLSWLGNVIGEALDEAGLAAAEESVRGEEGGLAGMLAGMLEALDSSAESDEAAASAARAVSRDTPAARGGAHTNQDFRYSRFDITQRFEEGFDPDRIAVAFADDLGRVGEMRVNSGMEPLFGLR